MFPHHTHLLYRRQFLIGPRAFSPTPHWRTLKLTHGLYLSVHPDLEIASSRSTDSVLVLLGYAIDPYRPHAGSQNLVEEITATQTGARQVISSTDAWSGRWVLIYMRGEDFLVFTDPCGLRQVYFFTNDEGVWCVSQPEIIRANCRLEPNPEPGLQEFLSSPRFLKQGEWIGDKTRYLGCFHLLPNHSLDLRSGRPVRFFPSEELLLLAPDQAIQTTAQLLSGTISALVRRNPLMLPVTAGRDSRILLAAAREHLGSIYCYVDRKGVLRADDPDVEVPVRLSGRLGFRFAVENSTDDPTPAFMEVLSRNITGARLLPKTRAIYAKLQREERRVNVNGNGGELARNHYDPGMRVEERHLTAGTLASRCGYAGSRFAESELASWLTNLPADRLGWKVLDLLYWEQRMGNWGAQFPAEQDIAVEEVSPFNNRTILTALLGVPAEHRVRPDYSLYSGLVEHLWPEALSEPFNPRPKPTPFRRATGLITSALRRTAPEALVRLLKKASGR